MTSPRKEGGCEVDTNCDRGIKSVPTPTGVRKGGRREAAKLKPNVRKGVRV